jgi:lysophospholipase L1-like esterase
MRRGLTVRMRSLGVVAGMLLVAVLLATVASGSALADPVTGNASDGTYLALGDSVAFGYVPPLAVPAPKYRSQHSFVGYPEFLAQQLNERVWNASCPGETTASMLYPGVPSNGCENSPGSPVGYRTLYQLHVQYQGTQMEYALKYLTDHKHTQLVTIDIGANDVFLCQETTADHCGSAAELGAVVAQIQTNLTAIYQQLRSVYQGPIVTLTYYALNYGDPVGVAGAMFLDSVLAAVTIANGGIVADGFKAFQGPAAAFGGDSCAAGLLIKLPGGGCDVHPTAAGHKLLAAAIAKAIGA